MYVKNSLMGISYHDFIKKHKEIIDTFVSANRKGLVELTLPYLLKNTHIPQLKLYNEIHELLESNTLELREVSVCPYCLNEDKFNENAHTKCSRCKKIYTTNKVIEKFKLVSIKGE